MSKPFLVFVQGQQQVYPMQNTRHNDMAVGEKAYNSRDYKDKEMKYSFDINDIEHASRCWYAQLDLLAETEEADTQRCLDTDDIRYITRIMDANPKLKRLMPYIIQETMLNYEEF